jgi:F-type H+-transporting ATPase subunit a
VALVPRGVQNFMEVVLEQFQQMIDDVIGPRGRPYLPLIATLGCSSSSATCWALVPA